MKNLKAIWLVLLFLLVSSYSYASSLGELRVTLLEGDVQIKNEESGDWMPASINMPLREDDMLWVPERGRLELQLMNGTAIRLDENSSFEVLRLDSDNSQFYLTSGKVYVNFRGSKKDVIQIDAGLSSTRGFGRSIFKINVNGYGDTDISVLRGYVNAENNNGKTRIDEGNTLSMRGDNYAELGPIGPPDEWEQWNKDRNRAVYNRKYSSQYLPAELESYSHDLDENGKWVYEREYGYVWTPGVMVSADWAPYRQGKWVWMGGDFVWVSYEPWGWAPYHYGRWSFSDSIGWFWVPPAKGEVYWGPGYVGWVHTPEYVAWVPLAPREIYYGRGYYGPQSVNITNVNIQKTIINVQRNAHVRDGITAVSNDTFIKGRHTDFRVKENPFLNEHRMNGAPQIKPEKSMYMPLIKNIPEQKRPPKQINEIKVRDIKKDRPLVKEQSGSVFRQGEPQKTMPMKVTKEPIEQKDRGRRQAEQAGPQSGRQGLPPDKGKRPDDAGKTQKDMNRPYSERRIERTGEQPEIQTPAEKKQKGPQVPEKQPNVVPPKAEEKRKDMQRPTVTEPRPQKPVVKQPEIQTPVEKKQKGLQVPEGQPNVVPPKVEEKRKDIQRPTVTEPRPQKRDETDGTVAPQKPAVKEVDRENVKKDKGQEKIKDKAKETTKDKDAAGEGEQPEKNKDRKDNPKGFEPGGGR